MKALSGALVLLAVGCPQGREANAPSTSADAMWTTPSGSPRPVGRKLVHDMEASPRKVVIGENHGKGLGKYDVTVDGAHVWPPKGAGCDVLVRCCKDLVTQDEQLALSCLLAVGRDRECRAAQKTVAAVAAEREVRAPASCAPPST